MTTQVFGTRMLDMLETSLRQISQKIFGPSALVLKPDEFVRAFINPEHVDTLTQVRELVGHVGLTSTVTKVNTSDGMEFDLSLAFNGWPPITMPQYVRHGLQPTCPDDVRARITAWLDERYQLGAAFGDVHDALYYLNQTCGDAKAVALMMPCLPTIMAGVSEDGDNATVKRARRITAAKSFGKLPALPVAVKQRLIEVSAIVNATAMMEKAESPTTTRGDAVLSFRDFGGVRPSLFGGSVGRFM